jgi:hypothetical protein
MFEKSKKKRHAKSASEKEKVHEECGTRHNAATLISKPYQGNRINSLTSPSNALSSSFARGDFLVIRHANNLQLLWFSP